MPNSAKYGRDRLLLSERGVRGATEQEYRAPCKPSEGNDRRRQQRPSTGLTGLACRRLIAPAIQPKKSSLTTKSAKNSKGTACCANYYCGKDWRLNSYLLGDRSSDISATCRLLWANTFRAFRVFRCFTNCRFQVQTLEHPGSPGTRCSPRTAVRTVDPRGEFLFLGQQIESGVVGVFGCFAGRVQPRLIDRLGFVKVGVPRRLPMLENPTCDNRRICRRGS